MFSKKKVEEPLAAADVIKDDEHFEAIVKYINTNDVNSLNKFLTIKNLRIDDRNENGTTGLMVAAEENQVEFAEILLSHKADPNGEDLDNWTPLTYAARHGSFDVCKTLLLHKADVDHKDVANFTPLIWAAYYGYADTVRLLAEYGANLEIKESNGLNALMFASGRNHVDVVKELLEFGAKVNTKDKFGTTPIVYASRKGYTELVSMLIEAGAGLDYRGMYGWTALLLAVREDYEDTVQILLKRKQNVNITDKQYSNRTPLMIACRKGNLNNVRSLLSVGANPNLQDNNMNTALIYALKGKHFEIVNMLLQKHVDINVCGDEQKTAIFVAVEIENLPIINLVLSKRPDLEIATVRGDTPLLRAVKSRNLEVVQLLLMYRAKVSAVNKKGDNVLHIALRARSKLIIEALLHDPKNAHLLYHPNKMGETPYNLDRQHKTPILEEVFGATKLSKVEQMKGSEGYNLYCNVLTEMLSEPNLTLPMSVGIYANWSSGKSIFLEMVRERMQEFSVDSIQPPYPFILIFTLTFMHFTIFIGLIIIPIIYKALARDWLDGFYFGVISNFFVLILMVIYGFLYWWKRYKWMIRFNRYTSQKLYNLNLALQVLFLHQPPKNELNNKYRPVKFIFVSRKPKVIDLKDTMIYIINKLHQQAEFAYGRSATRLFRALQPKFHHKKKKWSYRRFLHIPTFLVVEITFFCLLIMLMTSLGVQLNIIENTIELNVVFIVASFVFVFCFVMNICPIIKILFYMIITQDLIIKWKFFTSKQQVKSEGIYWIFKEEIDLLIKMITCLDECSKQQTRLVILADELELCDSDKELIILDLFNSLFLESKKPFILLFAIDPEMMQKSITKTDRTIFKKTNFNAQDFLRNFINLPMVLRNIQKRSIKQAQTTSKMMFQRKKSSTLKKSLSKSITYFSTSRVFESMSINESSSLLRFTQSTYNKSKEQIYSQEKIQMTEDDFFTNINPRSLRTFMNILYFISRLLKYYNIEFNWYHLINWICITYQWPFRTSFLVVYCEFNKNNYNNNVSLKEVYDDIKDMIPNDRRVENLLNLDADEKKFYIYISYHEKNLLVGDLEIFYPFSIHLDKSIRNYIRDEKFHLFQKLNEMDVINSEYYEQQCACVANTTGQDHSASVVYLFTLPPEMFETKLSQLKVHDVCVLFDKLDSLIGSLLTKYNNKIVKNNINGKVLLHCNMEELKGLLNMSFGDWETFRTLINELRYCELTCYKPKEIKKNVSTLYDDISLDYDNERSSILKTQLNTSTNTQGEEEDSIVQSKRVYFHQSDSKLIETFEETPITSIVQPAPSDTRPIQDNSIYNQTSSLLEQVIPDSNLAKSLVTSPSPKPLVTSSSSKPSSSPESDEVPVSAPSSSKTTDPFLSEADSKTTVDHEIQTNFQIGPDDIGIIVGTVVGKVTGQVHGRMYGSSTGRGRSKIKVSGRSIGRLTGLMTGNVKGTIKRNLNK